MSMSVNKPVCGFWFVVCGLWFVVVARDASRRRRRRRGGEPVALVALREIPIMTHDQLIDDFFLEVRHGGRTIRTATAVMTWWWVVGGGRGWWS